MPPRLEDIKTQAELDAAIKKMLDESTKGLKDKNTELLSSLKSLKERMDKLEGVDVDELLKLKESAEEMERRKEEEKGNYEKIINKMKTEHEAALKKAQESAESAQKQLDQMVINSEIGSALDAAKINPVLRDSAVRLLSGDVSLTEKDGKRVAMIGDKPVSDYVKDWSATDVGKNFILADDNSGGGGGGNKGDHPDDYSKFFTPGPDYNVTKQTELYKKDPAKYRELMSKHVDKTPQHEKVNQSGQT